MPYLRIQTNAPLGEEEKSRLLKTASGEIAGALGKPESYVMVAVEAGTPMSFAGSSDPCAYLELKSLGLPRSSTPDLSQMLCGLMETHCNIPPSRTYIEFVDPERSMWGWNSGTF